MSGDRLGQLLRNADGLVPDSVPAPSARELAESVRQRHRRRQARRARTGAVAAVVVACVALSALLNHRPEMRQSARSTVVNVTHVATAPAPTIDPEQARAAYRRLVAEADRRESIAAKLNDSPSSSRIRASSAGRSASGELRLELRREEATLLLLHQGDALARDPALRESAAVAYRQAADLFPETSGAAAAKQRLDALN